MNEGVALIVEDRKERPCDRDGRRKITFRSRESVCSGSALKEEPRGKWMRLGKDGAKGRTVLERRRLSSTHQDGVSQHLHQTPRTQLG
jgi:hypothetical protein